MLLPVAERTRYLFGKDANSIPSAAERKKKKQRSLFEDLSDAEAAEEPRRGRIEERPIAGLGESARQFQGADVVTAMRLEQVLVPDEQVRILGRHFVAAVLAGDANCVKYRRETSSPPPGRHKAADRLAPHQRV